MLSFLKNKVQTFWTVGSERTLKIKRNIIYTFLIKGISVFIGFMLIPLTIDYLNPVQNGIWITIASLVSWINTFDIGLSNGLRNRLAHSLALGDKTNMKKDISTTYALLFIIASVTFILFFSIGSLFNWNDLLKVPLSVKLNIWPVIILTLGFFCVQFILQPINSVLIATHQPFKSSLILLLGQALTYILIYVLSAFTKGNLFILVFIAAGSPVLVLALANIYLYNTSLKKISPRVNAVLVNNAKSLLNIGGAFFLIQIGALVLYETDNILITRMLGPGSVTTFNIPFKYFSIISIIFYIIITPYWSAFTDAYARRDFEWIKSSLNKMRLLWVYVSAFAVLLYFFSGFFYKIWIHELVTVPDILSLSMAIYSILQTWMVIHAYLLNGIGKLRIQLIMVLFTGVMNIPLSIWLINNVGISGAVWANIITMIIMNIFITYQCKLIVERRATGIWYR
ncbi:MATE family efflux transporter [Mucilaginibacter segetis]|uniref:Polysaccharide biosynthesis C-terminal domain-containing protein n=1 Tax=Mucilaginibacter segetis TaxID=2793071 RepID=A0A934PV94_9SPHI|nr:polysaccharide biosynthesis C-terminal domain-containing protein [Mucilaginibacter segetis]MBK0380699.1 polysaccharide biosynthesis C-terminal domain-containing protein [Mucilaginibacter segetis]